MKIVGLSDTVLGYGSPQIQRLMSSLGEFHGCRPLVLEPHNPKRAPKHELCPEIDIEAIHVKRQPYGWPPGRAEYLRHLARRVNEIRPDVLVIFCTFCVPVLKWLKYRPKTVIYHAIEMIEQYGTADVWLNITYRDWFDLIIFPEFHRAALDSERCLFMSRPSVVLLNCVNKLSEPEPALPFDRRNGRILNQGTIGFRQTYVEYFTDGACQRFPVDMYGGVSGADDLQEALEKLTGNVRYKGTVDGKTLAELRRNYSWGIVTWAPSKENTLYAASNKFFEYLASGVPAITAPHPQHVEIVKRYGCGIVIPDWSLDSFLWSLGEATRIAKSDHYAKYVDACQVALREELNWESQFQKFLAVYETVI